MGCYSIISTCYPSTRLIYSTVRNDHTIDYQPNFLWDLCSAELHFLWLRS